jgi:hypothetical protein
MKLLFANYGIEYLFDFKEKFFLIYMSDIYVHASMIWILYYFNVVEVLQHWYIWF